MTDLSPTLSLTEAASRTWPVAVVGAGPAGSFLARSLARDGIEVLLIDKAIFPRWKVCGCCLNGPALRLLEDSGLGELTKEAGAIPLTSIHLSAGKRSVDLNLPKGAVLSRETFDATLIRAAVKEGAAFLPGTAARLLTAEGVSRPVRVRQGGEEAILHAEIVVAADGLGGPFLAAEPHHRARADSSAWIGAGTTVDCIDQTYHPGAIYMRCGNGGYVGLVRLEDGRLDAAAALDPALVRRSGSPARAVAKLLSEAGWPLPFREEDSAWRGTPSLTRQLARPAGERYFVVGDAAGYVEPFTGEGMAWALGSSWALTPLIREALSGWRSSLIVDWRRRLRLLLGKRRTICWFVTRILRLPTLSSGLVALLNYMPFVARPFLASLNRPFRFPGPGARDGKK